MKFLITYTTSWGYHEIKEINTLEELIDFQKEKNENIILEETDKWDIDEYNRKHEDKIKKEDIAGTLEIYDGYRE